jgi:hypothetical protein
MTDERPDESPSTAIEGTAETEGSRSKAQLEPARAGRNSLDAYVTGVILELQRQFPSRARHRPKAFKARVLHLVARQLPPFSQPAGRPPA